MKFTSFAILGLAAVATAAPTRRGCKTKGDHHEVAAAPEAPAPETEVSAPETPAPEAPAEETPEAPAAENIPDANTGDVHAAETPENQDEPKPESGAPGGVSSNDGAWTGSRSGRATFYEVAGSNYQTKGSCGDMHFNDEYVVALWQGNMDGACGRRVKIRSLEKNTVVEATVVDTCPYEWCGTDDIDLSPAVWEALNETPGDAGARIQKGVFQITWDFA